MRNKFASSSQGRKKNKNIAVIVADISPQGQLLSLEENFR